MLSEHDIHTSPLTIAFLWTKVWNSLVITDEKSVPTSRPLSDHNPSISLQQKDSQTVEFPLPRWARWWFGQTASGKLESKKFWWSQKENIGRTIRNDGASLSPWTQAVRRHFPSRRNAEDRFVIPLIGRDYIITGREWSHSLAGERLGACSIANYLLLN